MPHSSAIIDTRSFEPGIPPKLRMERHLVVSSKAAVVSKKVELHKAIFSIYEAPIYQCEKQQGGLKFCHAIELNYKTWPAISRRCIVPSCLHSLVGDWPKYHSSPIVSPCPILILAFGSSLDTTVAGILATILNLCPLSTFALDVLTEIYFSQHNQMFPIVRLATSTYNTGSVTTAEVSVSIGCLARAVYTSLLGGIAASAGVSCIQD